jgi:glycosyltransferase involved in cell wall biosynthesis
MSTVCMISSLHGLYDDRIYWKEALSLKQQGYKVIHVGTGNEDLDFISEHGIRLIQIAKKRYFRNPYADILFRKLTLRPGIYSKMARICSDLRADVYHYHDIQVNRIIPKLKRLPHAPKLIYDVHEDFGDLLLSQYPKPGFVHVLMKLYCAWLDRWELAHASSCDVVIAAVEHIRNKFPLQAGNQRSETIYNYTTLIPERISDAQTRKYDAIYCGQINPFRGALQIAGAVRMAKTILPSVRVLLLGPVPDARFKLQLLEYIEKNGLEENVILYGEVPYSDIGNYYRDSRIGLGIFMPVSIFFYGIQIKTFEYMAFGLPVICSNFGTIGSIVTETGTGILVDPHSPEDISNAMITLLTDQARYNACSENGIHAVKNRYNWKTEEKKLLRIYQDLTDLPVIH